MILHHADGLLVSGQAQHQLDKISARGPKATGTEYARSSNNERRFEVCLRVQFARKFRHSIGTERMRPVLLGVGTARGSVENVVGGEVDEFRVELAASHG